MKKSILMAITVFFAAALMAIFAVPSWAFPLDVISQDGPQDPLRLDGPVHELGDQFPIDELIHSSWTDTTLTSCFENLSSGEPSDNPNIPNILVSIKNLTRYSWYNLHYVADPDTNISNFDGFITNAGSNDFEEAFKIDNIGINKPLVSEDINPDLVFQPNETWEFIIQDFHNASGILSVPFASRGIASASLSNPQSSGSIVATPVPGSFFLLAAGLAGLAGLRRKSG